MIKFCVNSIFESDVDKILTPYMRTKFILIFFKKKKLTIPDNYLGSPKFKIWFEFQVLVRII